MSQEDLQALFSAIVLAAFFGTRAFSNWLKKEYPNNPYQRRIGWLLFGTLLAIGFMVLFPPWKDYANYFKGYGFLFNAPRGSGNIYIQLLLVQFLVVIGAAGMIAFFFSQNKE